MSPKSILLLTVAVATASCSDSASPTYTLYRNTPVDLSIRVHWATFDAKEPVEGYNRENCFMAAKLLNENLQRLNPKGTEFRYWCSLGTYKA